MACVGGGSNAIGLFHAFQSDSGVQMTGVEAGGKGISSGSNAARFLAGSIGVFHGSNTFVLQDDAGQISETHSISAGLDYPRVGPELSFLKDRGRVKFTSARDEEALSLLWRVLTL